MTTLANEVEILGMRADVERLRNEAAEWKLKAQNALAEGQDFDVAMDFSARSINAANEADKVAAKLERATGEAQVDMRAELVRDLKSTVSNTLDFEAINELVRQIWAEQVSQKGKLHSVILGFDYENPGVTPTISIVSGTAGPKLAGGKRGAKAGGDRTRTRYVVGDKQLGPKNLVLTFGPEFGQMKPYDKMDPKERQTLVAAIVAGKALETVQVTGTAA